LGSITDLKPRAKLAPTGPVCGAAGIPVSFTAPYAIPFYYILNYKIDGIPQVPDTITTVPDTLPTPIPGVYQLTDFTYNSGGSYGVADEGTVTVYATPTTSDAGPDRAICGITTANLAANTPVVGDSLWTIVAGLGGNVITPLSPTSQFIGLNGVIYTLRWTISSGSGISACTSVDDVIINFTLPPAAPAASANQSLCGPSTIANLIATPPAGCSVDWYNLPAVGVLLGSGTALVSGTTYYGESKVTVGGCISSTRTAVTVTINSLPNPGIGGIINVCLGSPGYTYSTESDMSNYTWSVVGGSITSPLGTNTVIVVWNTPGSQSVSVNYQNAAECSAVFPTLYGVTVNDEPTITLGANPAVCFGTTTADLTYSTTTGTPNRYSIDYDGTANGVGFNDIGPVVLPSSPIVHNVPGTAPAGTYFGTLTVSNSVSG